MPDKRSSLLSMIFVPLVITLIATTVRLLGELYHWSPMLFENTDGRMAPFGISWLIFVFGLWFGIQLQRGGAGRASRGKTLGIAVLAVLVLASGMYGGTALDLMWFPDAEHPGEPRGFAVMMGLLLVATIISFVAWPRAAATLLVYGFLARLTVVVATLLSVHYGWKTHYNQVGPGFPEPAADERFLVLSMPHIMFWPSITVILGTITAAIGAMLAGGSKGK